MVRLVVVFVFVQYLKPILALPLVLLYWVLGPPSRILVCILALGQVVVREFGSLEVVKTAFTKPKKKLMSLSYFFLKIPLKQSTGIW